MIKKAVTKTTKQLAQSVARQLAQEPLEIMKTARSQVSGQEKNQTEKVKPESGSKSSSENFSKEEERKQKLETQGVRQIEALQKEIEDIRAVKAQREMQSEQQELAKGQEQKTLEAEKPLPQVTSKRGRRLSGMIGQIKKFAGLQGKERVKPPSG